MRGLTMATMSMVMSLLMLVTLCDATVPSEQVVFYIAGLYSTAEGQGVLPAVKLAVQHVNTHLFHERGFKLEMCWEDTKVGHCVKHLVEVALVEELFVTGDFVMCNQLLIRQYTM